MRERGHDYNRNIRQDRFPASLFVIYLCVLLLMSGIHMGLIVFMETVQWNAVVQSIVPILYWAAIALGLTLFARCKMREVYEDPMHKLADATTKVAQGDFSVYVPTIHTADKWDYLDAMIVDFNKMVEELGSIETLKTDFISNVSHEMKTPIAVIKNYAELLQQDGISEEQRREYSLSIENTAAGLSDLITDILRLNKMENQRITPEVTTYDLCRQLCECILQFEDAWDEKKIRLETEIEDAAIVRADAGLLELVWNNLLSNAIKFTEPGGRVTVSQTSDTQYVRVSVSDTGCGISRENMAHIFDKFYQGDTSHSKEGNGLGLALVKRVLELTDGDIQVSGQEGSGSTFTVTLPAAEGIGGRS